MDKDIVIEKLDTSKYDHSKERKYKDVNNLTPDEIYSVCMEHNIMLSEINNDIDEHRLSVILEKYKMTEFKNLLLKDSKLMSYKNEVKDNNSNYLKSNKKSIKTTLDLLNTALLFFDSKNSDSGIDITFTNINNKTASINNPIISKIIEDKILELLFQNGISLSDSAGLLEMAKAVNSKSPKKRNYETVDKSVYIQNPKLRQNLVREYRQGLHIKSQVTKEYLESKISEYNTEYKKLVIPKGVESTNMSVGIITINLSYLIRFKKFISQNKINNIRDFKLNNDSKRFIYEMLELLGLISDEQLEEHNYADPNGTTNKPKFVKSIIKQRYDKSEKSNFIRYGYNPDDHINQVWNDLHQVIYLKKQS